MLINVAQCLSHRSKRKALWRGGNYRPGHHKYAASEAGP
jgi:hypothetical protein